MDPDPDPLARLNTDPIRIRIPNPVSNPATLAVSHFMRWSSNAGRENQKSGSTGTILSNRYFKHFALKNSVVDPHPHDIDKLDLDPHPHQSDKLDPDPHQVADDKPKCIMYGIWAYLKVLSSEMDPAEIRLIR
jgi:hypothetical protein